MQMRKHFSGVFAFVPHPSPIPQPAGLIWRLRQTRAWLAGGQAEQVIEALNIPWAHSEIVKQTDTQCIFTKPWDSAKGLLTRTHSSKTFISLNILGTLVAGSVHWYKGWAWDHCMTETQS